MTSSFLSGGIGGLIFRRTMKLKYLFAWWDVDGEKADKLSAVIKKILAKGKRVIITIEEGE